MIQAKKITALTSGLMIAASALAAFPAAPVSAATLLIAEFETTDDSFTSRGSATVHWTSDQAYNLYHQDAFYVFQLYHVRS